MEKSDVSGSNATYTTIHPDTYTLLLLCRRPHCSTIIIFSVTSVSVKTLIDYIFLTDSLSIYYASMLI